MRHNKITENCVCEKQSDSAENLCSSVSAVSLARLLLLCCSGIFGRQRMTFLSGDSFLNRLAYLLFFKHDIVILDRFEFITRRTAQRVVTECDNFKRA